MKSPAAQAVIFLKCLITSTKPSGRLFIASILLVYTALLPVAYAGEAAVASIQPLDSGW